MTWPAPAPFVVSEQPQLGEPLLFVTPGARVLVDPTLALRAEVAELSLRLAIVETRLARPWWGARLWAVLVAWWEAR